MILKGACDDFRACTAILVYQGIIGNKKPVWIILIAMKSVLYKRTVCIAYINCVISDMTTRFVNIQSSIAEGGKKELSHSPVVCMIWPRVWLPSFILIVGINVQIITRHFHQGTAIPIIIGCRFCIYSITAGTGYTFYSCASHQHVRAITKSVLFYCLTVKVNIYPQIDSITFIIYQGPSS